MRQKIILIGSGNLATCLSLALHGAGHSILQVYSRSPQNAKCLADKLDAQFVSSLADIACDADFYILAVPDNAIEIVARQLPPQLPGMVLHVSGSTGIDILASLCKNYGVLYPLQTFSKDLPVSNFSDIPIFIEAGTDNRLEQLGALAASISLHVEYMNSNQRLSLHVAAVFSCNFVNHLMAQAFDLLHKQNISVEYLRLLLDETIRKAFESGKPSEVQTGPAVRKDTATMQKHLDLLKNDTSKKQLYEIISEQIMFNTRDK